MSLTKLLPVILLMMATGVQASTRDEIERLWNPHKFRARASESRIKSRKIEKMFDSFTFAKAVWSQITSKSQKTMFCL